MTIQKLLHDVAAAEAAGGGPAGLQWAALRNYLAEHVQLIDTDRNDAGDEPRPPATPATPAPASSERPLTAADDREPRAPLVPPPDEQPPTDRYPGVVYGVDGWPLTLTDWRRHEHLRSAGTTPATPATPADLSTTGPAPLAPAPLASEPDPSSPAPATPDDRGPRVVRPTTLDRRGGRGRGDG